MILPRSIAAWPLIWKELYEERAALMEFSGNITRQDAEREAERDIRGQAERVELKPAGRMKFQKRD